MKIETLEHAHKFDEIAVEQLAASKHVVRWCRFCGAFRIDEDYAGQTSPEAYRELEFPQFFSRLTGRR